VPGLVKNIANASAGATSVSESKTYFGGLMGMGYRTGAFDVRVGALTIDYSHLDASTAALASFAYVWTM